MYVVGQGVTLLLDLVKRKREYTKVLSVVLMAARPAIKSADRFGHLVKDVLGVALSANESRSSLVCQSWPLIHGKTAAC